MVHDWAGFGLWEERHKELVGEAERSRLARELREGRKARSKERPSDDHAGAMDGTVVRWGTLEDERGIADLLELNGIPRWIAFEERYIVAERDGEILAALRYRAESERLLLGLLASDPWAEECSLAVALYSGAGELAREMGVGEVVARPSTHEDYAREAGYRRRGRRGWRLDATVARESREEIPARGWRRAFALLGVFSVPLFGAFSARR
jgi:hypothetical protein